MDKETKEIYQQFAAVKSAMLSVAMMSVGGIFIFFILRWLVYWKGRRYNRLRSFCRIFVGHEEINRAVSNEQADYAVYSG